MTQRLIAGRKFGALRDVHDVRDRAYRAAALAPSIPQRIDLRQWAGPIKDQGEEGSCTGHAFSSAREWIARRYEKSSPVLSPQFLYVEELIADKTFPNDEGAMPRTACATLTTKGCCEASLYPYIAEKFTGPTVEQEQNALKFRTGAYHRISSLHDLLSCVSDPTPWPVTVGFTVYDSFMSDKTADTGVMAIPQSGEAKQGGHEVLCVGYDLPNQLALIQNSWGDAWGQRGYFWMPFSVLASPDTDLWVVHTGGAWR